VESGIQTLEESLSDQDVRGYAWPMELGSKQLATHGTLQLNDAPQLPLAHLSSPATGSDARGLTEAVLYR